MVDEEDDPSGAASAALARLISFEARFGAGGRRARPARRVASPRRCGRDRAAAAAAESRSLDAVTEAELGSLLAPTRIHHGDYDGVHQALLDALEVCRAEDLVFEGAVVLHQLGFVRFALEDDVDGAVDAASRPGPRSTASSTGSSAGCGPIWATRRWGPSPPGWPRPIRSRRSRRPSTTSRIEVGGRGRTAVAHRRR